MEATRQRTECTGYLSEGEQEVLIYPGGEDGVGCRFVTVEADSESFPQESDLEEPPPPVEP